VTIHIHGGTKGITRCISQGFFFGRVKLPTPPHPHLPPALAELGEKPFRASFGCHFCGDARGASTTRKRSKPIRKYGSKAPPPNATTDRSEGSLAIWRLSHVMYSSAQASQTENGTNE